MLAIVHYGPYLCGFSIGLWDFISLGKNREIQYIIKNIFKKLIVLLSCSPYEPVDRESLIVMKRQFSMIEDISVPVIPV